MARDDNPLPVAIIMFGLTIVMGVMGIGFRCITADSWALLFLGGTWACSGMTWLRLRAR